MMTLAARGGMRGRMRDTRRDSDDIQPLQDAAELYGEEDVFDYDEGHSKVEVKDEPLLVDATIRAVDPPPPIDYVTFNATTSRCSDDCSNNKLYHLHQSTYNSSYHGPYDDNGYIKSCNYLYDNERKPALKSSLLKHTKADYGYDGVIRYGTHVASSLSYGKPYDIDEMPTKLHKPRVTFSLPPPPPAFSASDEDDDCSGVNKEHGRAVNSNKSSSSPPAFSLLADAVLTSSLSRGRQCTNTDENRCSPPPPPLYEDDQPPALDCHIYENVPTSKTPCSRASSPRRHGREVRHTGEVSWAELERRPRQQQAESDRPHKTAAGGKGQGRSDSNRRAQTQSGGDGNVARVAKKPQTESMITKHNGKKTYQQHLQQQQQQQPTSLGKGKTAKGSLISALKSGGGNSNNKSQENAPMKQRHRVTIISDKYDEEEIPSQGRSNNNKSKARSTAISSSAYHSDNESDDENSEDEEDGRAASSDDEMVYVAGSGSLNNRYSTMAINKSGCEQTVVSVEVPDHSQLHHHRRHNVQSNSSKDDSNMTSRKHRGDRIKRSKSVDSSRMQPTAKRFFSRPVYYLIM